MLDDPHWGWHAAQALGAEVKRPPQYLRAESSDVAGSEVAELSNLISR